MGFAPLNDSTVAGFAPSVEPMTTAPSPIFTSSATTDATAAGFATPDDALARDVEDFLQRCLGQTVASPSARMPLVGDKPVRHDHDGWGLLLLENSALERPSQLSLPTVELQNGSFFDYTETDYNDTKRAQHEARNQATMLAPRWARKFCHSRAGPLVRFSASDACKSHQPFASPPVADPHYQQIAKAVAPFMEMFRFPQLMKVDNLAEELAGFPNRPLVESILLGYRRGFYAGNAARFATFRATPTVYDSVIPDNLPAREAFQKNIQKDLPKGRVAYVQELPPFAATVKTFVVPKDESKFRTIWHLSYPKGESVNHWIGEGERHCTYDYLHELLPALALALQLCPADYIVVVFKIDVEGAFRTQPTHWSVSLRQFYRDVDGHFVVNRASSFGDAHAAQRWSVVSGLVAWAARERADNMFAPVLRDYRQRLELCAGPPQEVERLAGIVEQLEWAAANLPPQIKVYVDDFNGISIVPRKWLAADPAQPIKVVDPSDPRAHKQPQEATAVLDTFHRIGLNAAPGKDVWGTRITITSLVIDTVAGTIAMTDKHRAKLLALLDRFSQPTCKGDSVKHVQQLVGRLNWAITVFPHLKVVMPTFSQMLARAKAGFVCLTTEGRRQCRWAVSYLSSGQPLRILRTLCWDTADADTLLFADATASQLGIYLPQYNLGLYYRSRRERFAFPNDTEEFHIGMSELLAQFVGIWFLLHHVWPTYGVESRGNRLLAYTDNAGVQDNFATYSSSLPVNTEILKRIVVMEQQALFSLRVQHIPGKLNMVADGLSRNAFDDVAKWHPGITIFQLASVPALGAPWDAIFL
jgi:hypothetical protein